MTRQRRHRVVQLLVVCVTLALWTAGGFGLHRYVSHHNNMEFVDDLARQLIRRAERSVDYVVIAGLDVVAAGVTGCGPDARSLLRNLAIETSNTRSIYLVSEETVCQSFEGMTATLPPRSERETWITGRNSDYRFGPATAMSGGLLGVSRGMGTAQELVFIINPSVFLFDVLDTDLRPHAEVQFGTSHVRIASFTGTNAADADTGEWHQFIAEGERYPLRIEIAIDPAAFATWRRDIPRPIAVIWSGLGLMLTGVMVFALRRGREDALDDVLDALDRREIIPYFQPIVDLKTGRVIGCEALARWIKPDGSLVSPAVFIPLIEKHNLNDRLFRQFVHHAGAQFAPELLNRPDFYTAFNVTLEQLGDPEFVVTLQREAALAGLTPNDICIEVTERQLIASPDKIAAVVEDIKAAGFCVAIDDAGTGHNGLATLQRIQASKLKIDKFFVDHIAEGSRSRVMIDMFVSVARRYGMTTIAEGVETLEQAQALRAAGVDAMQGFYVSPAVPGPDFLFSLSTVWTDLALPTPENSNGTRDPHDSAPPDPGLTRRPDVS